MMQRCGSDAPRDSEGTLNGRKAGEISEVQLWVTNQNVESPHLFRFPVNVSCNVSWLPFFSFLFLFCFGLIISQHLPRVEKKKPHLPSPHPSFHPPFLNFKSLPHTLCGSQGLDFGGEKLSAHALENQGFASSHQDTLVSVVSELPFHADVFPRFDWPSARHATRPH